MLSFTNFHFLLLTEIAIIGGRKIVDENDRCIIIGRLSDVEMISINKDSISHINSSIPSLPYEPKVLSGAQLPNGDLVLSGGSGFCNEYLYYKEGSHKWTKIGSMKKARSEHSSVWMDGRLFTTGGRDYSWKSISHHEEFSFDGGVKERKEMPTALYGHTSTIFDENKIIVCGGYDGNDGGVSKIFFILRFEK